MFDKQIKTIVFGAFLTLATVLSVSGPLEARDVITRKVVIDGIPRSFTVHLPDDVAKKTNVPVLFAFHPKDSTAGYMEKATEFHKLPEAKDYIIVYPQGYMNTWNVETCCGGAQARDVDDVAFFRSMMREVGRMAPIRREAYLTGFSNGAFLVYRLACEAREQVAAAVPFAGYLHPDQIRDCKGGPVPLLHIHGAEDGLASVDGGESPHRGFLPPAIDAVEQVAKVNGARTSRTVPLTSVPLDASCEMYQGARPQMEASLCIIPGLGHVWPGARNIGAIGTSGPYRPDVQGSEAIIAFFNRF
jgi:polyhydroxybutyrate depolymerase